MTTWSQKNNKKKKNPENSRQKRTLLLGVIIRAFEDTVDGSETQVN